MGLAVIAMGGNLGDVRTGFVAARADLEALQGTTAIDSSALYQSKPLGPPGQPDYLNAVLLLRTDRDPKELLCILQGIERKYGRIRGERWAARTLDLDMIAYDAIVLDSETLILPHPRMHERMFVLQPMCDVLPDWIHPKLGKSARTLLNELVACGNRPLDPGESW
jgi:2-amino-4-hydroxy-6-hydroxymethyldihydropteridine diphosphokinase